MGLEKGAISKFGIKRPGAARIATLFAEFRTLMPLR
jgi:hypothetical protein